MRLLKKMISAFLVVCMVISMVPMAALAAETDPVPSAEGRIIMDQSIGSSVWIDGVEYAVQSSGGENYVDLPVGTEPGSMVTYSYHVGDADDVHTQYPVGMQVWALNKNADGSYTPEAVEELNNILQYSGSSIRITGNKGIRMITSIEQNKKNDLTSGGLGGYKLLEYGTVLAWSSNLAGGNPLVLGPDYAKSNYAYKKGVADPIFAYSGSLMQYTNVLVGFTLDQCKDDISMRPYMILEKEDGQQITIYGGIVQRSIGYIAWQNKDVFAPGTAAYNYVWEIINHVYAQVTFETNGGNAIENAFVRKGDSLVRTATPVRTGYTFAGWYTDAALTQPFNASEFAIREDITLYAKWTSTGSLPMPENPSEADEYFWSTSDVIEVIPAEQSVDVLTEVDVINLLKARGFDDYPVTYEHTITGQYVEETEISQATVAKHPLYYTFYVSANRELWLIYVVNGMVMANPISFNMQSTLAAEVMVSESETVTSYNNDSNQFYVNIPHESTVIVKTIDRIDAETLDELTVEEINEL